MLIAVSGALIAGCGGAGTGPSSSSSSGATFASCAPYSTGGSQVAVLSVAGIDCEQGTVVISSVIAALVAGRGRGGLPFAVDGWRCVSFAGTEQATCTRGRETIYAEYVLS